MLRDAGCGMFHRTALLAPTLGPNTHATSSVEVLAAEGPYQVESVSSGKMMCYTFVRAITPCRRFPAVLRNAMRSMAPEVDYGAANSTEEMGHR